jgi:hypothetical protein
MLESTCIRAFIGCYVMNAAWRVLHARAALHCVRTRRNKNKENGGNMKSRRHLKTVLFIAGLLAVGTTMGTALLIERQGSGSQASGKSDQSRGAVGRPTHAPMTTGGIHDRAPDAPGTQVKWVMCAGARHPSCPGHRERQEGLARMVGPVRMNGRNTTGTRPTSPAIAAQRMRSWGQDRTTRLRAVCRSIAE